MSCTTSRVCGSVMVGTRGLSGFFHPAGVFIARSPSALPLVSLMPGKVGAMLAQPPTDTDQAALVSPSWRVPRARYPYPGRPGGPFAERQVSLRQREGEARDIGIGAYVAGTGRVADDERQLRLGGDRWHGGGIGRPHPAGQKVHMLARHHLLRKA